MGAHQALEAFGFAPPLLSCQRLPGPWLMVVMPYLKDVSTWSAAMQKPEDRLHAAVNVLHSAGYVHGDLRGCNVMMDNEKVRGSSFEPVCLDAATLSSAPYWHFHCSKRLWIVQVYVVDFEWAGKEGEARYPLYINHANIQWPEGASDSKLITKAHDLHWVRVLLSE